MADSAVCCRRLTPPGRGALGALGLRGPGAASLLTRGFSRPLHPTDPTYGRVLDRDGETIDDGVWIPTGGDEGILTLHGNPALLEAVFDRLVELGARAEPGAIERWARGEEGERGAGERRDGEAGELFREAYRLLPEATTVAAAGFILGQAEALDRWARAARSANAVSPRSEVDAVLSRAAAGLAWERPPRIAIAGVPNAGKSTLFNRLLGRPRVVVAESPGTTRDVIEARGLLADRPVIWIDGAGLRPAPDRIEREGVERMRGAIERADLVLLLVPPDGALPPELSNRSSDASPPLLRFRSRADQIPPPDRGPSGDPWISAESGEGIEAVMRIAAERLFGAAELPVAPTPFTARQLAYLRAVREARGRGEEEGPAWNALLGDEEGSR